MHSTIETSRNSTCAIATVAPIIAGDVSPLEDTLGAR